MSSAISADALWEQICGQGSLLDLFARIPALNVLVQDLAIEIIECPEFGAAATLDPDDNAAPLIRISTGCYDHALDRISCACALLRERRLFAWELLGWKRSAFSHDAEFSVFITRVMLDFMVVHEMSHVVRGHVDRYVEVRPAGMEETGVPEPNELPALRRLALELDADSVALYHFITLAEPMRENCPLYLHIPSPAVFISTLVFAVSMLFAILNEGNAPRRVQVSDAMALAELHEGLTHPLPAVRDEFADQRIRQLALDGAERRVFHRAIARSRALLLRLVGLGFFPTVTLPAWQHEAHEIAAFLNLLIDEIVTASNEGWMSRDSRIVRALDSVEELRQNRAK